MFYTPDKNDHGLAYNPFKAIISPRPIGWISTIDKQGRANLAPYSFFNGVSAAPPMVGFTSAGKKHGINEPKDSLVNILETGEFCVNIVSYDLRNAMNITSGHFPHGDDEFTRAGLTKAKSKLIDVPYVKESPISLECKLFSATEIPTNATWIMGTVVGIHIGDQYIKNGILDVTTYRPLARLGYRDYSVVNEVFTLDDPATE